MSAPRPGSDTDDDGSEAAPPRRFWSPAVVLAVGATVAIALLGSFLLVLTPSLGDRPGLQTLWVLFSLVMLKVPLLALVWWMIARRRRRGGAQDGPHEPAAAFIARIDREAAGAAGEPDAAARLASLRAEAWSEVQRASEADAPALVELALRLERPGGRRPPPPRVAPGTGAGTP